MSHSTRVLVVDDDPVNSRCVAVLLTSMGVEAVQAVNGLQGWHEIEKAATSRPYLVVISDYRMPGLDGRELLAKVANMSVRPYTLLMSIESKAAIEAAGPITFDEFSSKPITKELLDSILKRVSLT